MFSRWRQISNSNRMRNICRNGARSEADLAQCGALALPPPFLCLWLFVQIFFSTPPCVDHFVIYRGRLCDLPPMSGHGLDGHALRGA